MNTPTLPALGRRSFIKLSSLIGGGLSLGLTLRPAAAAEITNPAFPTPAPGDFAPNFHLRISPSGAISIVSQNPEVGQGIKTSLPMLIAEELEVDWQTVEVVQAGFDQRYERQIAGGSGATPKHFTDFRQLGATAKAMLISAAAETWNVDPASCYAKHNTVFHRPTGRSLPYGKLVAVAATLPVPTEAPLKEPADFTILGTRIPGVDNPALFTGKPLFGIDQTQPGMVHATYVKCPVFGGKVARANLDVVKAQPGISDAFVLKGTDDLTGLLPGVAIIGDSTWSVFQAAKVLEVKWIEGDTATQSTTAFAAQARKIATGTGQQVLSSEGDVTTALANAATTQEAFYAYPYLSHANLEPQNCTASVTDDRAEFWAPTQLPAGGRGLVAKTLGIPEEKIFIHMTRIGGGFGRRLMNDYLVEAGAISQHLGQPVKVTWTREADMQHDFYRPGGWHQFKGGVDAQGNLVAWQDHFVTVGVNSDKQTGNGAGLGADEFPVRFVPHSHVEQTVLNTGIPVGWWRAPGSCALAFAIQGFIDELAVAAKVDPVDFKLRLLGEDRSVPAQGRGPDYHAGRMKTVVSLAAEKADWGQALPAGEGRGIAFHFSHRGYVAIVAHVAVSKAGELMVKHMTAAVDVGETIVNLSGAENQVQGSLVDGLSTAYGLAIDIEKGAVQQGNFDTYPLLRIPQTPKIDVHFHATPFPPTGLGEPALPPVAPAIANAIYAATGKRLRSMPFNQHDLSWS